jgi:nucleotide-binding universal stress UspA family protein
MKITRILVAIDGSPLSSKALSTGCEVAVMSGAQLAVVHVVDTRGMLSAEGIVALDLIQTLVDAGNALLSKAVKEAALPVPVAQFLRQGSPGPEVCACAKEWGADLIVLGTHGRSGIARLLIGSTAEVTVRHAPCPVLVIPDSPPLSR